MFSKLALKNVTRSLKDYSVYFLTLTFGVCIFYVFNSLDSQWVMEALQGGERSDILDNTLMLVDIFSVFVSVILAFLILYANNFMFKRRKKELGTYMLLGLSQGRIASLLFLETLLIGVFSLAIGLALGVFLSQFISVFTAGLFQIAVPQFHFVFSLKAFLKTLLYFGVIFLVVMVFNSVAVSRRQLIDLLQAERKNEDLKLKSIRSSVVLFVLSVLFLAVAYTMLLKRGLLRIDALFYVMLALGSLGTLFFFRALSGFLLRVFQANKKLYYKGLNMFTLRQFAARVGSNYVTMTVICLMLLLAIGITACSVGMNNTLDTITNQQAPYDFFLAAAKTDPETGRDNIPVDVPAVLKEAGFDPAEQLSSTADVTVWYASVTLPQYMGTDDESLEYTGVLTLSTYNAMRALSGQRPISLEPDRYGQTLSSEDSRTQIMAGGPVLEIQGRALLADPNAVFYENLSIGYSTGSFFYLIVPDDVMAQDGAEAQGKSFVSDHYYCGNYRSDVPKETTEALLREAMQDFPRLALGHDGGWTRFNTKLDIYMETMGTKIMVLFLGIYLGIVFLLCSAAVLALQQLSQAADNAPRYKILARLGAEEKMRSRSIYVQVLRAFLLPLLLALVHSVVGMTAANAVIAQVGRLDTVASSAVTAVFIVVFYGTYLLATCWGSKRIVKGR